MFCENCGNEINENALFCVNCGTAVGSHNVELNNIVEKTKHESNEQTVYNNVNTTVKKISPRNVINKFSSFFGIALMILAFVDYYSDPPVLTILMSIAIIAGAISCLVQKYKLKGFTIVAVVLAIFCLLAGLNQGRKYGYFKILQYGDVQNSYSSAKSEIEPEKKPGSSTGITDYSSTTGTDDISPEFKKQVDDLEKFYNDYCDFMEEYAKSVASGDIVSMMDKYTKFLSDYVKYEAELEKLNNNQDSMSQAEINYFLDAYNRIMKRLANAAYSVQ